MILIPLFRGDGVPATPVGGVAFTRFMLRGAWHFLTIVMLSVTVLFLVLSLSNASDGATETTARVVGIYFAVASPIVLVASRGRHFAWLLAAGIAITAWWGTV